MHDRLNDRDIEAILRGDAEVEVGLTEFLTRARSSAEWSPNPETRLEHLTAAANAVTPGVGLGETDQPPVGASKSAMKGIKLKIRTLTRSTLTWIVAAATVLFGATGALAATSHLPQPEQPAISNAASKIGRDLPDPEDSGVGTLTLEEASEDDPIPVVTTTVPDDTEEHTQNTEPDDQIQLIVVDQNQTQPNGGCQADDQDDADVEGGGQVDQQQAGELDEHEIDQPDDECEIEDANTEDQDPVEVEDTGEHNQKQASDVDENEVESNDPSEDTEVDDHKNEDDHHSGDTQEHDSGNHESDHSGHEEPGD